MIFAVLGFMNQVPKKLFTLLVASLYDCPSCGGLAFGALPKYLSRSGDTCRAVYQVHLSNQYHLAADGKRRSAFRQKALLLIVVGFDGNGLAGTLKDSQSMPSRCPLGYFVHQARLASHNLPADGPRCPVRVQSPFHQQRLLAQLY